MEKKLSWIWFLAFGASVAYFFWTYDDLPERVATHFDAAGNPNGFQTKAGYLAFFLQFTLLMNTIFGALSFFISRIPVSLLNIPGKDYWLANPGRIEALQQKLRIFLALLGTYVNCVFLFTVHIVYQANTSNAFWQIPITGGVFFLLLGSVFVVVFAFILLRPPREGYSP